MNLGVSALAGLFASAAIGLFYAALINRRERAALAGGIAGVRPSDGPGAALLGTLEPLGAPLCAPMDDTPCFFLADTGGIVPSRGPEAPTRLIRVTSRKWQPS